MNLFTAFMLYVLPLSVSAATLLECKPMEGDFQTREIVLANIVVNSDKVMLFQQAPVFESVTFEVKKAVKEDGYTTFTKEILMEEVITLDLQDEGQVRTAILTRESDSFAPEYFFERIMMKCRELN